MKKLKRTKSATPTPGRSAAGDRDDGKAATKPPAAALLPENLPKAERMDRENDFA